MALGANAKLDLLKRIPLFEHCSKKDLQRIAQIADELDLRAGKVLITKGSAAASSSCSSAARSR